MGSRITIPVHVQGITRKETILSSPTEGTHVIKGKCLNQQWKHWNEGKPIQYAKNKISAPQDKSDGSAITSELRTQQKKLSIMKKYNIL
eukprot:7812867-Heterocapsa_arctica.AAC.1